VREQGQTAANMLLDLIDDPDYESKLGVEESTEWPVELLIRSSTARPAKLSQK
jgi:DNA-binding LacI/PurR family transcriptional regulator